LLLDRPVDIKLYLAQLQLQYDNAPNQAIRKIIGQDIDKAEMFSSSQLLMPLILSILLCLEIKN
jgi:hypothetical protein